MDNHLDFQSLMRLKGVTKAMISRHLNVSAPTAKKYYEQPSSMSVESLFSIADLAAISPTKLLESVDATIHNE